VLVLVLGFFKFLSTVFPTFSLVLDPRGRLVAWEGRLGMLVRNLRTMKVIYLVHVFECSGVDLPWLSMIRALIGY